MLHLWTEDREHAARVLAVRALITAETAPEVDVLGDGRRVARPLVRRLTGPAVAPWTHEIAAIVDVTEWARGEHVLTVCARVRGTEVARESRTVVVDPAAVYAPLRACADPGLADEGAPPADLPLLLAPTGPAARDPATDVALRAALRTGDESWRPAPGVEGRLRDALDALVRSGLPYALLVEEPGVLAPGATSRLRRAVVDHGHPDVVYADDELTDPAPGDAPVRLKPTWSPDLLLQSAYAGPLALVGRDAAAAALAAGEGPADLRELLLGLDVRRARVVHVPRSLFIRTAPTADPGAPLATAPDAGPVDRCVSVVVCTRFAGAHVAECLESLVPAAAHTPLEIVLVADGTPPPDIAAALDALAAPVVRVPQGTPFNYSAACNAGARAARGDELLFLNDDIVATDDAWLERMRAWLHRPGVGLVGAHLTYPGGLLQHTGVITHPARIDNLGCAWPPDEVPGDGRRRATNPPAVTGACTLVRRDAFEAVGGYDDGLVLEFSDVDLAMRLAEHGARTVSTPEARLVHHEGATRGSSPGPGDHARFMARWGPLLDTGEPASHPALDPLREIDPPCPSRGAPAALLSRESPWAPASPAARRRHASGPTARAAAARVEWLEGELAQLRATADHLRHDRELAGVGEALAQEAMHARWGERDAEQARADALRREALAAGDRATVAARQLAELTGTRAWRLARALQHVRRRLEGGARR